VTTSPTIWGGFRVSAGDSLEDHGKAFYPYKTELYQSINYDPPLYQRKMPIFVACKGTVDPASYQRSALWVGIFQATLWNGYNNVTFHCPARRLQITLLSYPDKRAGKVKWCKEKANCEVEHGRE
jgi:hypothetical protein